jgi:hypothetical protein
VMSGADAADKEIIERMKRMILWWHKIFAAQKLS